MNYISKNKVVKLFNECMDELYMNSEPSISWKDIQEKYKDSKEAFYLHHSISEEKYEKIVDKYRKKVTKLYWHDLEWFLLDYAPTTVRKEDKL